MPTCQFTVSTIFTKGKEWIPTDTILFPFRNCGKVFCNNCTNFTLPVPQQQLNSPVRVCRQCYNSISEHLDEATILNGDLKGEATPQAEDIEAAMMDDITNPDAIKASSASATSFNANSDQV